jgi:hypothetical protein
MATLFRRKRRRSAPLWGYESNPLSFASDARRANLGVRPTMVIPSATSTVLGQGKLSFGPSVVALIQPGDWTLGVIVNNIFSVAGSSHRPSVNQMTLQYCASYNLRKGWNVSTGAIITASWHSQAGGEAFNGNDTTGGGVWTFPSAAEWARNAPWIPACQYSRTVL